MTLLLDSSVRSMPGGIIRVEEIGGAAYALTVLSPERGGSFNITGGTGIYEMKWERSKQKNDLQGRKVETPSKGMYIIDGKSVFVK